MIYLNYAGVGLLPESARQALHDAVDRFIATGSRNQTRLLEELALARATLAGFIGAAADEIAFTTNTGAGLKLVADGLDWKSGDEVIVFEHDFPANVVPWLSLRRHGVTARFVPMRDGGYDLNEFAARLGPRTRLVAVSQVNFMTGFVLDLKKICALAHANGTLVCVDAIQGLGAIPLSVAEVPVDFLAAGGHKWLCGPSGSGFLFCRRQNLDRISHGTPGWLSFTGAVDFLTKGEGHFRYDRDLKPGAERFEGGVPNLLPVLGLATALRHLQALDAARNYENIKRHVHRLRAGLAAKGYLLFTPEQATPSGILTFRHPHKDTMTLAQGLLKQDIHIASPNGRLRVSPQGWVEEAELADFLAALPD